ncbi:MAG: hypothetical protein RLZZ400_503 [Actinomycetota bacterium]
MNATTFELTEALLLPVLERELGEPVASASWEIKALKPGAGNPTSLGVYRVWGQGKTASGVHAFSVVVKHLATGLPMMDASAPTSWNYWKREIDFFESDLATQIPASINFPKYLGGSNLPDGTVLFWNGDLGDLEKSVWSWDEVLHAATLVAELNSIDITDQHKFVWLNRDQLEGWLELKPAFFEPIYPLAIECALADTKTAKAYEIFGPYLDKQAELKDLLNAQRRIFVHGDFNLNNLVPRSAKVERVIALDWQLCGLAAIGSEVAAMFNTSWELGVIEGSRAQFDEICSVYVDAFNKKNPDAPCTIDEVRLVVAAQGYTILSGVGFYFAQPEPQNSEAENAAKIQRMIDGYSSGPFMVYAEVLRDLSSL